MSVSPNPQPGNMMSQLRGEKKSKLAAMASFGRMLKMVRPHRRILILGMILSVFSAMSYAASLAGLYPVFKVLLAQDGKGGMHSYLLEKSANFEDAGGWKGHVAPIVEAAGNAFPDASEPNANWNSLLILIVTLFGVNLIGNALRFLSQYTILYACNRSLMDVRRYMYKKALRMPMNNLTGDVSAMISQFLSDVREVYLGMTTLFGKVAREPFKAAFLLAAAVILDARLTIIVIAITPPAVGLLWIFGRKVRKATVRLLQGYGYMLVGLEECLQGLDVVKGYVKEGYERKRMWGIERKMFKHQMRLAMVEAISSPLIEVIGIGLASVFIVWLAAKMFNHEMPPDHFLAMVALLAAMLDPVRKVANVYNSVQRAGAASARIYETLDREEEASPPNAKRIASDGPPAVSLDNVTFAYGPGLPPALKNVSLEVNPGECIALVGPNGSGKSTLVKLLPKLLEHQEGTISVGSIDINELSLKNLRQNIATVSQNPVIFARTAKENIAYGKPNATLDEIKQAARHGFAAEFIESWADQYDTRLGEGGATISGGQRQRIAIARAFLKPSSIVIFDEATSQIDAESEGKIHDALDVLRQGKTTFLIAHRHTVMDMADRIAVMDAGQIVDIGTREELLERCPLFIALYRSPGR